jgi:hypothetical protein
MMSIGDTFQTGQTCPVSGVYENVTHPDPTHGQKEIPLSKGETFPHARDAPKR